MAKSSSVRVRFAPSPTGGLHIGSARTALFNWLYAKRHGGSFILRIEDTDVSRSTKQYEENILDGLKWLGLSWDEGPVRQSQRFSENAYQKYVEKLLADDTAYYCYCTSEELERDREHMLKKGHAPIYSGRCCNLKPDERDAHSNAGRTPVVRFRVPDREIVFTDLVRGNVKVHGKDFGDFVIARTDGTPLFLLVNIIDDAEMKISHVLRGEDHISNTPKQLLLAEALGLKAPQYGHLSLILNPDRSKMSKRAGPTHVSEYKKLGYLPEALTNYIALLGWNPGSEQELFALDELAKKFSVDGINKAGAVFDLKRLNWMNAQYIRKLDDADYVSLAAAYIDEDVASDQIERAVRAVRDRVQYFSELPALTNAFWSMSAYDAKLLNWKETDSAQTKETLESLKEFLDQADKAFYQDAHTIEQAIKDFAAEQGKGNGEVFWPLRVALSGSKISPGPQELIWVIGKKETLKRVDAAIEAIEKI